MLQHFDHLREFGLGQSDTQAIVYLRAMQLSGNRLAPRARRLAAGAADYRAVFQGHLDHHMHLARVFGNTRIRLQRYFAQQPRHVRAEAPLIGKGVAVDHAIEQRGGGHVLKTEFTFQAVVRLGAIGIGNVRRNDTHGTNVRRVFHAGARIQRRCNRKVRRIFRRIKFDCHARIDATIGFAVLHQQIVIKVRLEKRIHIAPRRSEYIGVGGEAARGQTCGFDARRRHTAAVRAFHH